MKIFQTLSPALKRVKTLGACTSVLAAVFVLSNLGAGNEALAAGSLAEQSQNPISSLISMPFEFDSNQNVGADNKTQNVLLFKPVVPVSLNENWNLVLRGIVPLIDQPDSGLVDGNTGLGDIQLQTFFVPAAVKSLGGDNFLTS